MLYQYEGKFYLLHHQILPTSPQKIIQHSNNNQMESKNLQKTSIYNGSQQTKEMKNILQFIQKTMETLSNYKSRFQGQLDIDMTKTEI